MGWNPFQRSKAQTAPHGPDKIYLGPIMRKHATVNDQTGAKEFAGIELIGHADMPYLKVPTTTVQRGISEGWIRAEDGYQVVHRPGGTLATPWAVTHTFVQYPTLTFVTVDGNLKYNVVHQADKYHNGPAGTDAVEDPTAWVDWFYLLERVMP